MTLNKAGEAAIALRRERVSQLVIRQLTCREIADALARGDNAIINPETEQPYTHVTIASDIKALKKEWSERRDVNMDEHINRQFAEQQEIKRAGWGGKDYELVRKTLKDEVDLLGTAKAKELNVNITMYLPVVTLIIELAEAIDLSPADVFEGALRRLQRANSR